MQIRAAFLDWSEDYTGPKFDLVLACDVLYEVSNPPHRALQLHQNLPCAAPPSRMSISGTVTLAPRAGLLCGAGGQAAAPAAE